MVVTSLAFGETVISTCPMGPCHVSLPCSANPTPSSTGDGDPDVDRGFGGHVQILYSSEWIYMHIHKENFHNKGRIYMASSHTPLFCFFLARGIVRQMQQKIFQRQFSKRQE